MNPCYCLEITARTAVEYDRVSGILALYAPYGWEERQISEKETCFLVRSEHDEYIRQARRAVQEYLPEADCRMTEMEGRDWLAAWREYFTPVTCGTRFVVLPPWLPQQDEFPGRTPIVIEPKSAFGTGHHATTALCLRALSDLLDSGRVQVGQRFLDLGTGSGVLAIACAKSGLLGLALDIDPLAVDNALENKALNSLENLDVREGGAERAAGSPYDLILANILAEPLTELAPVLTSILAGNGCLVLSGILEAQADKVEAAYMAMGLPGAERLRDGEWAALVWS